MIGKILRIVASLASVGVVIIAPNSASVIHKLLNRSSDGISPHDLDGTLRYMKYCGLISDNYEHGLRITPKGQIRLRKVEYEQIKITHPKKWDGKWRIVIYDVPERLRLKRINLSTKLEAIGLYQLQKSVWVYPFPCRDVIEKVGAHLKLEKFITIFETEKIDNSHLLEKRFTKILR